MTHPASSPHRLFVLQFCYFSQQNADWLVLFWNFYGQGLLRTEEIQLPINRTIVDPEYWRPNAESKL